MKISKKRLKMIEDALNDAFNETVHENLDETDFPPDNWSLDTTEKYDLLHEMLSKSVVLALRVFED